MEVLVFDLLSPSDINKFVGQHPWNQSVIWNYFVWALSLLRHLFKYVMNGYCRCSGSGIHLERWLADAHLQCASASSHGKGSTRSSCHLCVVAWMRVHVVVQTAGIYLPHIDFVLPRYHTEPTEELWPAQSRHAFKTIRLGFKLHTSTGVPAARTRALGMLLVIYRNAHHANSSVVCACRDMGLLVNWHRFCRSKFCSARG